MEGTEDINVTIGEEVDGPHFKRKENEQSLQSVSCNVMGSSAAILPLENDWTEPFSSLMSPDVFAETLRGKKQLSCTNSHTGNEWPNASPCTVTDSGVVVEELTLNNYRSTNLSKTGCSNSQGAIPIRKGQWQHLYQLAGGLSIGSSHVDVTSRELDGREDVEYKSPTTLLVENPQPHKHSDEVYAGSTEHLIRSDNNCTVSSNTFTSFPEGIRTTFVPASGFSHFFVKNTSKGKGVVYRNLQTNEGSSVVNRVQNSEKAICDAGKASNTSQGSSIKAHDLSLYNGIGVGSGLVHDGISLREWLKSTSGKINKVERMHIFKQILKLVDIAHSQGIALQYIRPSCFMILSSERVKYIGSWGPQMQNEFPESVMSQDLHYLEQHSKRKRFMEQGMHKNSVLPAKHQKLDEHVKLVDPHTKLSARFGWKHNLRAQSPGYDFREAQISDNRHKTQNVTFSRSVSNRQNPQLTSESTQLEERWYTSPEVINDRVCTLESNIYSLGVLLFELFCCFESYEVHTTAMSDIRNRILPPYFLSENPKEAGFCLWLLHPEPSSRPKTRVILQSELICEGRELSFGNQSLLSIDDEDAESELLLHFLISLNEQKSKQVSELVEKIGCLNADIEEVEKRQSLRAELLSQTYEGSNEKDALANFHYISDECLHNATLPLEGLSRSPTSQMNETRLVRNIKQLENVYFSVRSKIKLPETDAASRLDNDVIRNQDRSFPMQNGNERCKNEKPTDRLGVLFDGICKYARYNKFEMHGILRNDLLNSANVICSLSFDRDEDYFATAGVSKKIKIFEFGSLLNDMVDIHYPVVEMPCKSKLSCICWNNYIKNCLASTDYDGVVQLWDASTGQGLSQYKAHQKRAWSVDFSQVDPTKLASGSDDCFVKLWSISELNSISTIRNAANVCCVQFSPQSTHLLAFGSADYKIFCYDLRNTRIPWCTLAGHGKAVSYVKFLDPCTLVSASTDNTLKIWDLNKTTSGELSTSACSLTLSGHLNEKNFVGLSVSDGYIACGSETNEVFAYYRSLPMPITSHKFGSIDPISRQETVDDSGHFVSSVCWRSKSNMVVAANSNGSIRLLQMV